MCVRCHVEPTGRPSRGGRGYHVDRAGNRTTFLLRFVDPPRTGRRGGLHNFLLQFVPRGRVEVLHLLLLLVQIHDVFLVQVHEVFLFRFLLRLLFMERRRAGRPGPRRT